MGWIGVGLGGTLAANAVELAWAAGFFDGEGSTFLNRNKVTHYERPGRPTYTVNTPAISISQVDRRALGRFVAAVGLGKVAGPYKQKTAKSNPYYRVQVEGRDRVCAILTRLWPYLGPVKRDQARATWAKEKMNRGPKSPPMPALPPDILVDLDGTLAKYVSGIGLQPIGEPIMPMVTRVLDWHNSGKDVRIFTARAGNPDLIPDVVAWCKEHLGRELPVTNVKDFQMIEIYDDRAVQVEMNTGRLIGHSTRGL